MPSNKELNTIPEFSAQDWMEFVAIPYLTDDDPKHPPQGLLGDTGGGKTSICIEAAKKAGFLMDEICVTKPANRTMVDYVGVPKAEDGVTRFLPPDVVHNCITGKTKVLILDEAMDCGMATMQNLIASWLHDKEIAGHQMQPMLKILWTGNESHHRAGSQDINRKVSTRSGISRLGRSLDNLLAHAMEKGWRRDTVAYLHWKGEDELYGPADMDPREPIRPSPRQWEAVSKSDHNLPERIQARSFARYIPLSMATTYVAFLKLVDKLPPISEIMDSPKTAPLTEDVAVGYALVSRLLQEVDSAANFQHLMGYVSRMRSEPQTVFVNSAVKQCEAIKSTREYTKWALDNAAYFGFGE